MGILPQRQTDKAVIAQSICCDLLQLGVDRIQCAVRHVKDLVVRR
jgi:hypothetical protein